MESCDSPMANWTMEQASAWPPGLPVEYHYVASQIFGNCVQASVPSSGGQVVEYAAATQNGPIEEATQEFVVDVDNVEMRTHNMFKEAATKFDADSRMMKIKIHRYPPSIRALGDWYTVPRMVAIGPYHHGQDHLKPAETVKHVAAYHCIRESGHSIQEVYGAVISAAHDARRLYDNDVMEGIGDGDFLPMMFFDACFLVQYLYRYKPPSEKDPSFIDPSLASYFKVNYHDIFHDIMLLENQIPWGVVEAIMRFRPVPLKMIIPGFKDFLQDRKDPADKPFVFYDNYEPPHLLALLRFYIVGRSNSELPSIPESKSISFSVSAIELAEIGIRLTPSKTTELINMGMTKKGPLFAELSLSPLTLDGIRTSCLVNMAAFEVCSVQSFSGGPDEDSAVCSYLLLFSMIVDREEDVHELRTKHLLQGGGGLTNNEALYFFKRLESLRRIGSRCYRTMKEIENYKVRRPMRIKVNMFVYKNKRTIITVFPVIAALIGILGTLMSLKARRLSTINSLFVPCCT